KPDLTTKRSAFLFKSINYIFSYPELRLNLKSCTIKLSFLIKPCRNRQLQLQSVGKLGQFGKRHSYSGCSGAGKTIPSALAVTLAGRP
ncbi:TPA: hypothetical protein ACIAPS_004667, partial [Salmonella enterica subsp. enterica serovar Bovismorbificans]